VTNLEPNRSPCRRHPCSVEHADLVHTYRLMVEMWNRDAERVTGGYAAEMALYLESHPRPTLKRFLVASRRPLDEAVAA
jgi:hypothetical protein